MMAVFCGVTAMSGHLWPVYLSFRGGKGVATGAGVIFALNWMAALIAFGVWLAVFLATRYVSLGSVVAAAAMAVAQFATGPRIWKDLTLPVNVFCVVAALVIVWTHRENLGRLLRGEEKKFYFSRASS